MKHDTMPTAAQRSSTTLTLWCSFLNRWYFSLHL